ncbi:hypothetical protein BEN47_15545 [Hymenobacter lapidarius]|uniref:Uncharacterized protein n=1 Tax=Hymenobacter lapidarius TaxID=1908237 RepID=A0A1G1T263_9BACT|nr:hypothetical protein [Hymenobacter lapidarius]OGX84971.1 hypothetical protein BEN47_15545 [Hymenobacter lapidarius]
MRLLLPPASKPLLATFAALLVFSSCEKKKETMPTTGGTPGNEAALLKEIELLRELLLMKDQLIAAKDEMLTLLKAQYNRPN